MPSVPRIGSGCAARTNPNPANPANSPSTKLLTTQFNSCFAECHSLSG